MNARKSQIQKSTVGQAVENCQIENRTQQQKQLSQSQHKQILANNKGMIAQAANSPNIKAFEKAKFSNIKKQGMSQSTVYVSLQGEDLKNYNQQQQQQQQQQFLNKQSEKQQLSLPSQWNQLQVQQSQHINPQYPQNQRFLTQQQHHQQQLLQNQQHSLLSTAQMMGKIDDIQMKQRSFQGPNIPNQQQFNPSSVNVQLRSRLQNQQYSQNLQSSQSLANRNSQTSEMINQHLNSQQSQQQQQLIQSLQQSTRSIPYQEELFFSERPVSFFSPQKQGSLLRQRDNMINSFPKQFKAFQQLTDIGICQLNVQQFDQFQPFDSFRKQSQNIKYQQSPAQNTKKPSRPSTAQVRNRASSNKSSHDLQYQVPLSPKQGGLRTTGHNSNSFVSIERNKKNQQQTFQNKSNSFLMTQQITLVQRNENQQNTTQSQVNYPQQRAIPSKNLKGSSTQILVKSNQYSSKTQGFKQSCEITKRSSNQSKQEQETNSNNEGNLEISDFNNLDLSYNKQTKPAEKKSARKSTFGMRDLKKQSFSSGINQDNRIYNHTLHKNSQAEISNKISHSKSVHSFSNSRVQLNYQEQKKATNQNKDENEDSEYGDEDEDEDDDESYGDESENEKEELEFENEYDDGQIEANQKDTTDMLRQRSTDLSSEASTKSPKSLRKKQIAKKIEQIEEESVSDDNLDTVVEIINDQFNKTQKDDKKINLELACPKENLIRTILERKNSQQSVGSQKLNRVSSSLTNYQNQIVTPSSFLVQYEGNDYEAKDPFTQDHPVILLRSIFEKRPPVIFFQYPPQCNKKRDEQFTHKMKEGKYRLKFKISDQVHTYNCVVNSLCRGGFQQTDGASWNIMWSAPLKPECLRNYDQYRKCNHFPGTFQLGRKDNMYRHMSKMIREFGEEYRIVPKTWILPEDLRRFQQERDNTEKPQLWIVKPANSSCGRGIRILTKTSQLPKKGQHVVCEYIMKPHLINGYKYDLRLYVFITSYEPLTIYLYKDGLVRFATQPYNTKNTKVRFAHLTNFSVNKKATNFKAADESSTNGQSQQASKWSLKMLQEAFKSLSIDYDEVFVKIKDLIIKSILGVETIIGNNMARSSKYRHLCFELYGFDVILDNDLKPWLLEVNVLPSLSSSSNLDKRIKTSLLSDIFQTIGVVPYNKRKVQRENEALKWGKFSGVKSKINQQDNQEKSSNMTLNNFVSNNSYEDMEESWDEKKYLSSPARIRLVKELLNTNINEFNYEEQIVIVEKLEEQSRRGDFDRIFPVKSTLDNYTKYFKCNRPTNLIMWKWLKMKKEDKLAYLRDFKANKNQQELLNQLISEY